MSLKTIAQKLEDFASGVVSSAVEEAGEVGTKLLSIAKSAAEQAGDAIEGGFEDLVDKVGQKATELVTALMADDSLSGLEKSNLAATQLVEHAATNGITIAEQDVTALIKNAYLAVKAKIASL